MKLKINYLVSSFIPILIILSQYKIIGHLSVGIFIIFIITALIIISDSFYFRMHKLTLFLVLSMILSTMLFFFRTQTFNSAQVNFLIMGVAHIIMISTCIKNVNYQIMYKTYKIIGIICILIIIYQSIVLYVFGKPVAPISILPIAESDIRLWQPALRPSAIFTEPQAYCSFILPLLILARSENDNVLSGFIIASIILSGSSFGILSLAILLLYLFLSERKNIKSMLSMLLFIIPLILVLISSPFMDSAIDKISKIDITNQIRLSKGFEIYFDMSVSEKFFGLDSSIEEYIKNNIGNYPWAFNYLNSDLEHLLNYVTSFSGTFVSYGLIPGILFTLLIFSNYYRTSGVARQMSILIILMSFTATLLFNAWFVFYYILLFVMQGKNKSNSFYNFKLLGN
ncbi:hypothetical protein RYX27_17855 [Providencia hangzhouensis]